MLHEVRIAGEVVVLAMLKHKDAIGLQQSLLEDETRNLGQLFQGIRRIGKDEVELLFARLDETEHVATKGDADLGIELLQAIGDETVVVAIHLNADDMGAATRYEFEGDAARTREEVESCGTFEIQITRQYVEDVFLGKISRGSGLETPWNLKVTSLIFSRNNPHLLILNSQFFISSSFDDECHEVVWHIGDLGGRGLLEIGSRVDDESLLQITLQLLEEPIAFRDVTNDVHLVVNGLQLQLLPDVKQEVEGIVGMGGLEAVAELKAVLLEAEDVELLVVEIAIELVAMACKAALVEMMPYGRHRVDELYIVEAVIDGPLNILADSKETD